MTEERIKEMFQSYFNGTLAGEDLPAFRETVQQPEHAGLIEALLEAAYTNPAYREAGATEKEQALAGVISSIRRQAPVTKMPSRHSKTKVSWYYFAAAVSLVAVALGVWFYQKQPDLTNQPTARLNSYEVAPGSYKATLTLANGKKIYLNDTLQGEVGRESGVVITKNSAGQIVYQVMPAATSGATLLMNTLSTARHEQFEVVLPDGTHVWLNAASALKYPAAFTGSERRVELSGEGYFEIAANAKQPFIVVAPQQTLTVLGTHFNINAYPDEAAVVTTLLEGAVKVASPAGGSAVLQASQQLVNKDGRLQANRVDPEAAVAWKNGYFMFDNKDLAGIMREVSRWYDVEVVFEDNAQQQQVFNGSIPRYAQVSEVLQLLKKTGGIHYRLNNKQIIITQ